MDEIIESVQRTTLRGDSDSDKDDEHKQLPVSPHGTKHLLTPESKYAAESKPKRLASISQERKFIICQEIQKLVESQSSGYVKQQHLMDMLDLTEADKSVLTRCVKKCFNDSVRKIITIDHEPVTIYSNIALKDTPLQSRQVVKELFAEEDTDLSHLKQQVMEAESQLVEDWNTIRQALNESDMCQVNFAVISYQSKLELFLNLNSAMMKTYSKKLDILKQENADNRVSDSQKAQINKEIKELERLCCIGLRKDGEVHHVINERVFPRLLENFEETCPLIYSLLHALLVSDMHHRVHKSPKYKMTCGVNALTLLLSVRNQKIGNDIRLLFGLLCVTYGAGKQFINMLNAIGLTPHWDTITKVLDERLAHLKTSVAERCNDSTPVILLMDNINLYRGRKRHDRLFTDIGPKMWNFTGRAAIIPDMSEIEDLISCKETTTKSQIDITSLTADDLLLDSMPDHKLLWEKWCDRYYLQLLNSFLNYIPVPPKAFEETNETEMSVWLRDTKFEYTSTPAKYNLKIPPVSDFCKNMQSVEKTDVIHLPLSLEDNSTLTGTAAVLEEFSKEFNVPFGNDSSSYIEFDTTKKEFNLKSARERYAFTKSLQEHRKLMVQMEKQIISAEKDIEIDDLHLQSTQNDQSTDDSEDSDSKN